MKPKAFDVHAELLEFLKHYPEYEDQIKYADFNGEWKLAVSPKAAEAWAKWAAKTNRVPDPAKALDFPNWFVI